MPTSVIVGVSNGHGNCILKCDVRGITGHSSIDMYICLFNIDMTCINRFNTQKYKYNNYDKSVCIAGMLLLPDCTVLSVALQGMAYLHRVELF